MDSQPKRLQATALFLIAVLAIAGVFAAAYFIYPLQREPHLVKRNYRLLAAIAGQVSKRIEGLRRAVKTAQDNPNILCEERDTQDLKCLARDDLPGELPLAAESDQGEMHVGVYLHDDNGTLKAYFLAAGARTQPGAPGDSPANRIYPTTDLGKFVTDVVGPYGYFDTVLLASTDGQVLFQSDVPIVDNRALYQSSISTGRIASIQDLIAGERTLDVKDGSEQGPSGAQGAAPASYVFSPARFEKVQYLGEEFLLFAQPVSSEVFIVDPDSGAAAGPTSLVLFGLVSSRSFAAETRQIPWSWLGGLVFLLVLTFLSWPLLRLWCLAPGEPLRGSDVRIISFVFMAGAMVITFFVLDLTYYASISGQYDDLLEPLAGQIQQKFQTEIIEADQALTTIANDRNCRACSEDCQQRDVRNGFYFADVILADSKGHPTCRWHVEPARYKDTWQLTLMDKLPQIQLADRAYFREARRGMLWSLPVPDHQCDDGICHVIAEVVSSRISGDDVLVVARPLDESAGPSQQCAQSGPSGQLCRAPVGLVGTRMIPFAHPVLPSGYSFAIVNDEGDVQIHSVASRNKRENLFRECDDATGVRAAVGTRMPARLNVSYSGRDYRIYVTPIANTPWSLVVFRDKQLLWAANSEVISSWTMLTLLYLMAWLGAVIVLQVCDSTYSADWLWPCRSGGGARAYWRVAAQTGLLAAIAYLSLHRVGDLEVFGRLVPLLVHFAMVLIFPALTIALACLTLAASGALGYWEERVCVGVAVAGGVLAGTFLALLFVLFLNPQMPFNYQVPALALLIALLGVVIPINLGRPRAVPGGRAPAVLLAARKEETRFRFAYVSMLFSLVVALAVVPSMIFFDAAGDMEVTNLSRMAQTRWIESLAARAKRLRANAVAEVSSMVFLGRFDDTKDLYPVPGFPASINWQDSGPGMDDHAPAAKPRVLLVAGLLNGLGLPQFTPLMSFAAELRMMTSVGDTEKIQPYTWVENGSGPEAMVIHDDSLHDLLGRSATWDHAGLPNGFARHGSRPALVRGTFPSFGAGPCWHIIAGMALGAGFAMFAAFAALWSIARKVFLLDADLEGDESDASAPSELSQGEKLALWHLVRLGFLGPGDGATAHPLFRRGVLFRTPAFHVRDAEYKQIQQLDSAQMLAWEREARPPVSSRLHHVLLPAIALAMTFLFLTQRELFNSTIALIATLAAALPTVLKFFSQLGGSPEKS